MSSCDEIRALLGRYVDRELDPGDVNRVDNHVSVCESCAERVRLLEREVQLLGSALASDEAPAAIGDGLWETLRAERKRRVQYWTYGLAAAACLVVALVITYLALPGVPRAEVARVMECAGPLDVRSPGGSWTPLPTYAMLRDGDRVRCGIGRPGRVTLNSDRRIDLDSGAELTFLANGSYGHFRLSLERGRIRGELPGLRRELTLATPVADMLVMPDEMASAGRAVFEVRLFGLPEQIGWLDRVHILPAAVAAADGPELEVLVYEGSVLLFNQSRSGTAVTAGRRVFVRPTGPVPDPERFDARALRPWWLGAEMALARTARPEPPVAVAPPKEVKPEIPVPPVKDEKIFEPPSKTEPVVTVREPELKTEKTLAGPEGLTAHPEMDAVLLEWKPVESPDNPIVEYGVYRRAPGDTDFALVGRLPTWGRSENTYRFLDEVPGIGIEYEYAVAAAWRDKQDKLMEGAMSAAAQGSPADFRLYFTGVGTGKDGEVLVNVMVEKLFEGSLHRQSFQVRTADAARARTGLVGGPRDVTVEPIRGARYTRVIDFSTGYRLVEVVLPPDNEWVIPKKRAKIVVEDDHGVRREIEQVGVGGGR